MERACKLCLHLISQKKTYSTDNKKLKRKPPNEYHQMLPHYEGEYKPKQINIDFESAREILMKENYKMLAKRPFEGIYNMKECKSYMKNEDIPENKKIIVYGFKHNKAGETNNYISMGYESDELDENKKLFNFWSNKFINKKKNEKIRKNSMVF